MLLKINIGITTVIVIKLFKGLILLIAAIGVFSMLGKDLVDWTDQLMYHLRIDPESYLWEYIATKIENLTPIKIKFIGGGSVFYSLLCFTEGVGLICRWKWAAFLTVVEAFMFIPLELYSICKNPTIGIILVLIINIIIAVSILENWRDFDGKKTPIPS